MGRNGRVNVFVLFVLATKVKGNLS